MTITWKELFEKYNPKGQGRDIIIFPNYELFVKEKFDTVDMSEYDREIISIQGGSSCFSIKFINCENIKIYYTADILCSFEGNQCEFMLCSKSFGYYAFSAKIKGNNNLIGVYYTNYIEVSGNDNKIELYNQSALTNLEGKNNHICAQGDSRIGVSKNAENTTVLLMWRTFMSNESSSTHLVAFDSAKIETVPLDITPKTYGLVTITTLNPITRKDTCREPIDDKSGYYYKIVSENLSSVLYERDSYVYKIGEWNYSDDFDPSSKQCSAGLHFFPTIEQTLKYFISLGYDCKTDLKVLKLRVNFEDIAEPTLLDNSEEKFRASKVFVEKIVPEEEYKDLLEFYK